MEETGVKFETVIRKWIENSIQLKNKILSEYVPVISKVAETIIEAYKQAKSVYWFGNGGSAADAQHLSCELVNRFYLERKGIRSIALTTNTSILTAVANDYSLKKIFEKQVEALANEGDILVGISTSGNSINVVNALKFGKKIGTINIGLTGNSGGLMKRYVDHLITVPSKDTPFIQECHIMIGHIVCYIVENEMFGVKE